MKRKFFDELNASLSSKVENFDFAKHFIVRAYFAPFQRKALMHEKALLGALSGNLDAVVPVCESLEDFLWAYFKVALDVRVEREIRGFVVPRGPVSELPDAFWSREWNLETLFQQLEAAIQPKMIDTVMFQIVKNIIIGDMNSALGNPIVYIKGTKQAKGVLCICNLRF